MRMVPRPLHVLCIFPRAEPYISRRWQNNNKSRGLYQLTVFEKEAMAFQKKKTKEKEGEKKKSAWNNITLRAGILIGGEPAECLCVP